MITMQEAELKIYLRQVLRSWEHANNRIHMPSDVKYLIEFADEYYLKNVRTMHDNKNTWDTNSA